MTADLIEWLTAVLDEDERVARRAERHWSMRHRETDAPMTFEGAAERDAHIARHDPQSVLARVEAERELADLHQPVENDRGVGYGCMTCDTDTYEWTEGRWPCPTLRALAWGYRYRDGWQESWRPDGVEATTDA